MRLKSGPPEQTSSLERVKAGKKVECKLLWWLKLSFYPEPKADLTNNLSDQLQRRLIYVTNKLTSFPHLENYLRKVGVRFVFFHKSMKRHPNSNKVLCQHFQDSFWGLLVAWTEAYLYVWGVGRVDGDALSDENPHIWRQVMDLGQIRPPRLKQICCRLGTVVRAPVPPVWTSRPPQT